MSVDISKLSGVLHDPLWNTLGVQFTLPNIVVVGPRSSGKTSVLNELSGTLFPFCVAGISVSEMQLTEDVPPTDRIATKCLDDERCLIIAIIDGSRDIARNHVLETISQNARLKRAIGIVTKPDLIQSQDALDWYTSLLN